VYGNGSFAFGSNINIGTNVILSHNSVALGKNISFTNSNCFIWSDGSSSINFPEFGNTSNDLPNSFQALASGGFYFVTAPNNLFSGVKLTSGSAAWETFSLKKHKDIVDKNIDHEKNFDLLNNIPVEKWNYKGSDRVYLGVYIDDFFPAFNLGKGELISTLDYDGVAFSCLKGAYIKQERLQSQLNDKTSQINTMQSLIDSQAVEINDLKTTVSSQALEINNMKTTIDAQASQIIALQASISDILSRLNA
jgi:hypothetical protein